jgi:hypothetical protein
VCNYAPETWRLVTASEHNLHAKIWDAWRHHFFSKLLTLMLFYAEQLCIIRLRNHLETCSRFVNYTSKREE